MIGPIPRFVFGEKLIYQGYVKAIAIDAENVWQDINQLEMFKIPRHVKSLSAPYVRDGVDIPIAGESCFVGEDDDLKIEYPIYEFRFLSDYCLKLVSENVRGKLQLQLLSRFKLDYQIAQEIMINEGIMTPSHVWEDSIYLRSN